MDCIYTTPTLKIKAGDLVENRFNNLKIGIVLCLAKNCTRDLRTICVSDKPLHGELKLPGMATEFYRTQVESHLLIGIRAMEKLRDMPLERIHSRKLRSFEETAFL